MEAKKDSLRKLREEQDKLNKQCTGIEQEIRILDMVIKENMENQDDMELKMMGLELSEEIWRKKWEE